MKVRTSSLTVCRMKMGIDFTNVTELAPALLTSQIEVYPSLFTYLATDLRFMCDLFAHHFANLPSGYATCNCDKGSKLEKGAHFVSQSARPPRPKAVATMCKKSDQLSVTFFYASMSSVK